MSADNAPPVSPDAYRELSRDEQRDLLDAGFEAQQPDPTEHRKAFRALERARQESYRVSDDMSETEQAMAEALQQTWTANLFEALEDHPTVPFEMRRLPESVRALATEVAEILYVGEGAETEEELEELVADSSFGSADALDEWLPEFLAFATMDESYDAERFETGRGMVEGTRKHLLLEIYLREQEDIETVAKFRAE